MRSHLGRRWQCQFRQPDFPMERLVSAARRRFRSCSEDISEARTETGSFFFKESRTTPWLVGFGTKVLLASTDSLIFANAAVFS